MQCSLSNFLSEVPVWNCRFGIVPVELYSFGQLVSCGLIAFEFSNVTLPQQDSRFGAFPSQLSHWISPFGTVPLQASRRTCVPLAFSSWISTIGTSVFSHCIFPFFAIGSRVGVFLLELFHWSFCMGSSHCNSSISVFVTLALGLFL